MKLSQDSNLGIDDRLGHGVDLCQDNDAGEDELLGEDLGSVLESGISGRDRFARKDAAIGKVAVEIQGVDGDDEVA